MKPNVPIDVADFFKEQLHYQEIAPPDHIWSNIESEIPTYPTPSTWRWWTFNAIIVVVIFSVITYLWIHTRPSSSEPNAIVAYKHSATIEIKKPMQKDNAPIEQKSEQNNLEKTANTGLPAHPQQTVYYIEATTAGKLDKIEILDSLNKIKKTIINPTPNDYGFYEMNIEQLKPGSYTIVLHRSNGSIVHRKEIFR